MWRGQLMERSWHFISGLPRAGSTLTAAILRQNPRFHAGMSSPVASLFDGVIGQVSAGTELSTMSARRSARASCAACSTPIMPISSSR